MPGIRKSLVFRKNQSFVNRKFISVLLSRSSRRQSDIFYKNKGMYFYIIRVPTLHVIYIPVIIGTDLLIDKSRCLEDCYNLR